MTAVIELWNGLHPVVQAVIKGLARHWRHVPASAARARWPSAKISAWMQNRPGPNRAHAFLGRLGARASAPILQRLGVFHLMADGGKMFFKEDPVPGHVNKFYFVPGAASSRMIPALTTVTVGAVRRLPRTRPAKWSSRWCSPTYRRRHPRRVRGLLARRLLAHHRRLGLELEVSRSSAASAPRRSSSPTSSR